MSAETTKCVTVLYDGDCAFCVSWLRFWSPVLRRRGFEVDTLQATALNAALWCACRCRYKKGPKNTLHKPNQINGRIPSIQSIQNVWIVKQFTGRITCRFKG